jgi:hypothetical protein
MNATAERRQELLIVQARVSDQRGVTARFAACAPLPEHTGAATALAALALHLTQLRRTMTQPSAGPLLACLAEAVPGLQPYGLHALHDPRAAAVLDIDLHPLDASGWPGVRLAVLTQGDDPVPWGRTRRFRGAAQVLAHADAEAEAAAQHLAAQAHLQRARQLRPLAAQMGRLHQQLAPALDLANQDLPSRPVIPAPRDGSARYADEELPTPLVLTGAVLQDVELRTASGAPVARLLLAPDTPPVVDGMSVQRLTCDLHGDQARTAHTSLATGSHVLLAGTVVRRHYTGADHIPRTAVTLTVHHLGHALT